MSDASAPGKQAALAALLDRLIPGEAGGWPSASAAGVDAEALVAGLGVEDAAFAVALARDIESLAEEAAIATIFAAEAREPTRFRHLISALHAAYYGTEVAHRRVIALAERSPREASPRFDPTLLKKVLATEAGKRRLPP